MTDRELLELLVTKVTGMENRFDSLETELKDFRGEFNSFRVEVNTKLDNLQTQSDVIACHVLKHTETLDEIKETQKSVNEILGEHEIKIRTLRRRPV